MDSKANRCIPRFWATIVAFICIIGCVAGIAVQRAEAYDAQEDLVMPTDQVVVFRLFNNVTGEHLFTPQWTEVDALIDVAYSHWVLEGVAWNAPAYGEGVYRLFSKVQNDHLYTKDLNEVQTLAAGDEWVLDNNGQPMFYSGGSIDIYRLSEPYFNHHHLTTDDNEYAILPGQGWVQEGIAFQCLSEPDLGSAPTPDEVYRRIMAIYPAFPELSYWPKYSGHRYPSQASWWADIYGAGRLYSNVDGGTCYGFALMASDAVFGNAPGRIHYNVYDIRPGDIIHYTYPYVHYATVVKVNGDNLTLVDGNWFSGRVHWGRVINRFEVPIDQILTRYPA